MALSASKLKFNLYQIVAAIVCLKFALLAIDGKPCFYMGDSASYLLTASSGWAPSDRSVTYGLWLGFLTHRINSLYWVVFCQTLLSAAAASLVVVTLNRLLDVALPIAAVCGILCSLEPLQLLSERYILTEAPSTFLFAVLVTLALLYLENARIWLLFIIPVVGTLLVSLRLSYYPVVLLTMLLPALSPAVVHAFSRAVRGKMLPDKKSVFTFFAHTSVLALLTLFALNKYAAWYGEASGVGQPSLNEADGFFLLADVSPILHASDFRDPSFGVKVISSTKLDIRDPGLRTAQRFAPEGICATLIRTVDPSASASSMAKANKLARRTALRSVRNHPAEFLQLVLTNIGDYFVVKNLRSILLIDEFRNQFINIHDQGLIARFRYKVTRQPRAGLAMNWHYFAVPWYMLLILFPILPTAFLFSPGQPHKRQLLLLTAYTWSQWAICTIFIEHNTPRYETGLAWLFFPISGLIAAGFSRVNSDRQPGINQQLSLTATPSA